jgi:dsRNA-specific ribonuclease
MRGDRLMTPDEIAGAEAEMPRVYAEITGAVAAGFEKILAGLEASTGEVDEEKLRQKLSALFDIRAEKDNDKEAIDSALAELAEWHRKRGIKVEEIRKRLQDQQKEQ